MWYKKSYLFFFCVEYNNIKLGNMIDTMSQSDAPSKVELDQDVIAEMIFLRNTLDHCIGIEVDGISCNFDMFMFCTELLHKGLVMLYGDVDKRQVSLDDLSLEEFNVITKKLALAGIQVTMSQQAIPVTTDITSSQTRVTIEKPVYGNKLEDYSLVIKSPKMVYKISFKLIHNITACMKLGRTCS